MFTNRVNILFLIPCIKCTVDSRDRATAVSIKDSRNITDTLRQCISEAVLCASEYLRTDVGMHSQQTQTELEVSCTKAGKCCSGADMEVPSRKHQSICKEAGKTGRCSRREQKLIRLAGYVDAAAFKRFLYGKNKLTSGDETKSAGGAACETQASGDVADKVKLHMSSFLKRWLFLISYLGYSFLCSDSFSNNFGTEALTLLPLSCLINVEAIISSSKESFGKKKCKICNEACLSSSFSKLCTSCEKEKIMEKYIYLKQSAQKKSEDKQSQNRKNAHYYR